MVKVYSSESCMKCRMVKKILKSRNIEFLDINVKEDEEAITYLKNKGFTSLPVVESKDLIFSGLDMPKLNKIS